MIEINVFLKHKSSTRITFFLLRITLTIVTQALTCEIIAWLGILYYLALVTRVTNTISRTTTASRTVIWSFSITGAGPVANTTVSSPGTTTVKRSVTYFVTLSIASMILIALLLNNLLMKVAPGPESSSDLSAAFIHQGNTLYIIIGQRTIWCYVFLTVCY